MSDLLHVTGSPETDAVPGVPSAVARLARILRKCQGVMCEDGRILDIGADIVGVKLALKEQSVEIERLRRALKRIAKGVCMVEVDSGYNVQTAADRFRVWNSHAHHPDDVPGMRRAAEMDAAEMQRIAGAALSGEEG